MKHVLIVANLGGFASFLINDMKLLQSKGYKIVYASNTQNPDAWQDTKIKLEALGVEIISIDFNSKNPFAKSNFLAYKQIKKLLKEKQFDLIHCHTPIAGLLTRLAAKRYRKKGCRVIYTTHGFSFTSKSSPKTKLLYFSMEKFASKFCDAIITINKEDYESAKKMRCKNVYYINGVGVDTGKYREVKIDRKQYRKRLGISGNSIMVLSVGELSKRKNHQIIIEAISKLNDRKKYVYVICGRGINGGTEEELKKRAIEKDVNLKLLGFRSDIPEIIHCSDIGAIPSIREGLGLAGIQSLAAGIPLVGTDVQGIRDYIIENETGYLCDAMDATAFSKRIEEIISMSEEERAIMKQKCYEKSKDFDVEISRKQMEKIYQIYCV